VGLSIVHWNDPAVRYRRTQSADDLLTVLKERLRNGDSVAKLERLLGPGELVDFTRIPGYRGLIERNCRQDPATCPDGIKEGDKFLSYRGGNTILTVQARDGRLVNYDPSGWPSKLGGALGL